MKNIISLFTLAGILALCGVLQAPAQTKEKGAPSTTSVGRKGAFLGVYVTDLTKKQAEKKKVPEKKGAYINQVAEDSPADSAGLEEGDVIVGIDGKPVAGAGDVVNALKSKEPRSRAIVDIVRDGERKSIAVVLGERRGEDGEIESELERVFRELPDIAKFYGRGLRRYGDAMREYYRHLSSLPLFPDVHVAGVAGMKLRAIGGQLAAYFGAPEGKGVLVEHVEKGSRAERAGFAAGDVITRAGKKTVENVSDVYSVLRAYDEGERIPFEIIRKGEKRTLQLEAAKEDVPPNCFFFGPFGGRMRLELQCDPLLDEEFETDEIDESEEDVSLDRKSKPGIREERTIVVKPKIEKEVIVRKRERTEI